MITVTAQPGINHAAFNAAMHARFTDRRGNVQICHVAQRTRDGGKRIAIRINPLRDFQLPADAKIVAEAVLAELTTVDTLPALALVEYRHDWAEGRKS